jgi:hypothetical protein
MHLYNRDTFYEVYKNINKIDLIILCVKRDVISTNGFL